MSIFGTLVSRILPFVPKPIVYRVARQYVAGEELADAVRVVKELNAEGSMTTVDVLGEDVRTKEEVEYFVSRYIEVIEAIDRESLDANISVKPTMFGLQLDRALALESLSRVIDVARSKEMFVRIDMEDTSTTDDTFWLTRELRKRWPEVGVVIQAYLRRTLADTEHLIAEKTSVRVCKGIYRESREHAWQDRRIIIKNFGLLVDRLLSGGCYVGIATHDEACVWEALRVIDNLGLPPERYEFQMLLGVENRLRRILVDQGHRMRVYVPFGRSWYAYSMRRLKENPAIAGHITKALLLGDR